ncbi:MAG TPA: glyceraldehyde-3-phosphate dehydrogenase, partial [Microbacterium sp.]|nr:glyceraldehyde-3-phosphate dehydrogenase [Microbacterium sp.]
MTTRMQDQYDAWVAELASAEEAIPLIGRLSREQDIIAHLFGRKIVNRSPVQLIRAAREAGEARGVELRLDDIVRVLRAAREQAVTGASLDLGMILESAPRDAAAFDEHVAAHLAVLPLRGRGEPRDVVLYGFGRIGRLVARILIGHANGYGPRLRAIVVRRGSDDDLRKRAQLLRRDSVHGAFHGTIEVDEDAGTILANGTLIQVIYADDPAKVDYPSYGITDAIVVDNTGRWRDEPGLAQHLASPGVSRVVLTAPGKSPLKNIVFGINHDTVEKGDRIVTAASCTTNAITPVLKVLDDSYGIRHGHVETVHSYTNDQNLIDNLHKGSRRGRAAALNMVLTETGAAKAVSKALPQLEGKLTGNAIRVPTPDVSMAILNLELERAVERDEVNTLLREQSLHGELRTQIDYVESDEIVSSDFVGNNRAGIVDGLATIATGTHLVVYVWYDNEYGYSSQVVRL